MVNDESNKDILYLYILLSWLSLSGKRSYKYTNKEIWYDSGNKVLSSLYMNKAAVQCMVDENQTDENNKLEQICM